MHFKCFAIYVFYIMPHITIKICYSLREIMQFIHYNTTFCTHFKPITQQTTRQKYINLMFAKYSVINFPILSRNYNSKSSFGHKKQKFIVSQVFSCYFLKQYKNFLPSAIVPPSLF